MATIYEIGISTVRADAKRLQEAALKGAVPARRLAPPTLVLASDAPEAEPVKSPLRRRVSLLLQLTQHPSNFTRGASMRHLQ